MSRVGLECWVLSVGYLVLNVKYKCWAIGVEGRDLSGRYRTRIFNVDYEMLNAGE